jgi:hypothetical protein
VRAGRIEVANRPMMAFTQFFSGDARGALAVAERVIARAALVGHRRAEMIGRHAALFCRHALMEFDVAAGHAEAALILAQHLGARRFETKALAFRAKLRRLAGWRAEALGDAEKTLRISRDTGMAFLGPFALGALALASDDPIRRRAALEEAEAMLGAGAVSHNHLLFPRDAVEAYLEAEDWDGVERAAAELERCTRREPLSFGAFYIARARTLAACRRGRPDPAALDRLRHEAERLGLLVALPGIKAAINEMRA